VFEIWIFWIYLQPKIQMQQPISCCSQGHQNSQSKNNIQSYSLPSKRTVIVANIVSILPSLPCDPTIAKDPRRTPAKASQQEVSDLQICEQITSLKRHLLPL